MDRVGAVAEALVNLKGVLFVEGVEDKPDPSSSFYLNNLFWSSYEKSRVAKSRYPQR